jgi:hypothetical protein
VYYGVSFGSVDLGGNRYLNFFLVSLVGIPAYVAIIWAANRFVISIKTIDLKWCIFITTYNRWNILCQIKECTKLFLSSFMTLHSKKRIMGVLVLISLISKTCMAVCQKWDKQYSVSFHKMSLQVILLWKNKNNWFTCTVGNREITEI